MHTLRLLLLTAITVWAAGDVSADSNARPVGRWSFGAEESEVVRFQGNVDRDQPGPRLPSFPLQESGNTAIRLDGRGYAVISTSDHPDGFQFGNGDEMTIEAYVKIDDVRDGQHSYVISKGRTGASQFHSDNQNWAMRVVVTQGVAKVTFLFATKPNKDGSHWHRWTSNRGFEIHVDDADQTDGWHHLAVAYRFGSPDSIRGWIDSHRVDGSWDMGGATTLPPVTDEDDVWIGSSRGGAKSNSFHGSIDEVAVYRKILSDKTIESRVATSIKPVDKLTRQAIMPDVIIDDDALISVVIGEGMPADNRWLVGRETFPAEALRLQTNSMLLPRLPARFDAAGSRSAWKPPVLVRMAGKVNFPAGLHRLLMRTRSLGRLWVDGNLVGESNVARRRAGNLEAIVPPAEPPVPGSRRAGFIQQETIVEYLVTEPTQSTVVLEFIVGGKGLRTETGEVCVAVQIDGRSDFRILSPDLNLPLTDAAVDRELPGIERTIVALEDSVRRSAAASEDDYWNQRHELARQVHAESKDNAKADKSIEGFVRAKLLASQTHSHSGESIGAANAFYDNVFPILQTQCLRCHGTKQQGGLRLDSRQAALSAGESELPAIVPGKPDESELIIQIRDGAMPPTGNGLSESQIQTIEDWIAGGAVWPDAVTNVAGIDTAPVIDDAAFLRRVYLDTVGVPPTEREAIAFLTNETPNKRAALVDRLLADDRYADHWVTMYLDLLAENPTLLNTAMGSTGPFRWFLHDSLKDNVAADRMITNLILMRGDAFHGGSAGFALAGENDAPMAAKAHLLASAFLGIEMKCAKCHDSPYHSTTQEDLYSLAAMLKRDPITPPKSSRVPAAFFDKQDRESLIKVTMDFSSPAKPNWPFQQLVDPALAAELQPLLRQADDPRERAAFMFTAPINDRFPKVLVNHLWKRLIGTGIVEPVDDWEGKTPSHPELLDWLAGELVRHDYDIKHVLRLILNSDLYAGQAVGQNWDASSAERFFAAPDRRRLSAEQIVDSLFQATGRDMDVEELTFVHDGSLPFANRLSLGVPKRAWQFAGLQNERDRPSLAMPKAQAIVDVLAAFGWNGTRQSPIAVRDTDPNVLQPGILANGTLTASLSRQADRCELAELAVQAKNARSLVESLFLRFLTRLPTDPEAIAFTSALSIGFERRLIHAKDVQPVAPDPPLPTVTWTNHLVNEANEIQLEVAKRVADGPAPDPRLDASWREIYEDAIWSLINHNEFVWMP